MWSARLWRRPRPRRQTCRSEATRTSWLRYRIVALLGKGGMGEVYRGDDLRLSQTVAMKFLPAALSQDGAALAGFHREVRLARRFLIPTSAGCSISEKVRAWPFSPWNMLTARIWLRCSSGLDACPRTKPSLSPGNFARDWPPRMKRACCTAISSLPTSCLTSAGRCGLPILAWLDGRLRRAMKSGPALRRAWRPSNFVAKRPPRRPIFMRWGWCCRRFSRGSACSRVRRWRS